MRRRALYGRPAGPGEFRAGDHLCGCDSQHDHLPRGDLWACWLRNPFDTEEEAIALANGTTYGLAGGVFTKDIKRAIRVADKVKSGQIYVNNYFSKGMIESPGTGWKESGLGIAGIHKYMISKTVFLETIDDVLPPV